MPSSTARVTTVVMTRDRWPDLQASLPRHEGPVIVVDNGSTDGTPSLVRRHFPHVQVVELGRNRGVAARNIGARRARTPYVAFADDDSWWAPGALGRAADVLDAHPRLALLAARVLVGDEELPDPICGAMETSPLGTAADLPGPSVLGFLACGAVLRRSAFLAAGGFDEQLFFAGEEEKLALDLAATGWGLSYVDDVVAHHHPSSTRDLGRRSVRQGRNRVLTAVLRRPWPAVARSVSEQGRPGGAGLRAVAAVLPQLPTALARRHVIPPEVESARRLLEEPAQGAGSAQHVPSAPPAARPLPERPVGSPRDTDDARVTVVMITHNRRAEADTALRRLGSLPERPPVVVVDNGSTDGTSEMIRDRHPGVRLLSPGLNLGAVGRNLGVAVADTPYVAFCDDDTWYDPGALTRAVDLLDEHPSLAVVTARILVEPGGRLDPICEEMARSPLEHPPGLPGHPLLSFLAGVSVLRREAFEAAGGFSARLWLGGEEELLASDLARAGWHMAYVPDVVAHHQPSTGRDPHLRRRHGIRNTLWFTWLRRPSRSAARRTVRLVAGLPRDRVTALGLLDAVGGLPWVLRDRAAVPAHVERGYQLLDEMQLSSEARSYVS